MKRILLVVNIVLVSIGLCAQKKVYLNIHHKLDNSTFEFNKTAVNSLNDSFYFTRLDYYVSNLIIIHDGGQELSLDSSNIFLFRAADSKEFAYLGMLDVGVVEGLRFSIGVPEPINTDDPTKYTTHFALSPQSPSMHWGWASGYRFVVIEGKCGASFSQIFEFHSLFSENYFSQTVMTKGTIENGNIYIDIDANYVNALKEISLSTAPIQHGQNKKDLTVLENFRDNIFSPSPKSSSGLVTSKKQSLSIYPNPNQGEFNIKLPKSKSEKIDIKVYSALGQLVKSISPIGKDTYRCQLPKGVYQMIASFKDGLVYTERILIE